MDSSSGDDAGHPSPDTSMGAAAGNAEFRAGRRSNGLTAPAYAVLAHCEPQVADALLRSLAEEGIAAYAVPYEGSVGGYLEMHPPVRPVARVWVDSASVTAARDLMQARYAATAEPPAAAEEEAWEEIVASLRRPGADGPAPWPDAEHLPPPGTARPAGEPTSGPSAGSSIRPSGLDPVAPAGPVGSPTPAPDLGGDGTTSIAEPAEDDVDGHFVPPPPPPVPVPRGPSAYGIAALIGGALVLLVSTMAGDPASSALLLLAVAAIVGGFVTLVAGMREGPPTDSGPDDGAVL